ncbi:hypothetical protein CBF23_010910 [Marinomonas agarivorans]|nr:hypothetical protein CBF23_010910 [Marinomonas agarivorans]
MKKNFIALCIAITTYSLNANAEGILQVYQLAQQNDAGLKSAKATYLAKEEAVNVSRGSLFPSLSFSGNLGYSSTTPDGSNTDIDTDTSAVSLDLNYPIYSSALSSAVKVVKLNYKSAGIDYTNAEEDLAYETLEAYFNVLTQRSNLQIAKMQAKATASQLKKVKQQFSVGQVAITDVHASQAEYDANQVTVLTSEADLANAEETLYQLTGQRIAKLNDLSTNYPIELDKKKTLSDYVEKAHSQNKELQLLKVAYENALANIQLQKANGRSPTLSLTGSLSNNDKTTTPADSSDGASTTSSISLNLSIPLYEGGAINASVREATATAEATKESLNDALQNTELAVNTLYRTLKTSVAQIAAQQQLITSYTSVLKATQTGYESGTRNIIDLLDAQSDLFDAQGTYQQLRYNFVLQQFSLLEYIGELNESEIKKLDNWMKG